MQNARWLSAMTMWTAASAVLGAGEPVPADSGRAPARPMLERALAGPLAGCRELVFAVRSVGSDGHYYANFGYYDNAPDKWAYYTLLTTPGLVAHGQDADGNRPPRSVGSSASRLMAMLEPAHFGVQLSATERRRIRLWIETGAAYPGTCAAMEVTAAAYHVPDFRPNVHYVREMKRYGILPADFDRGSPLDVYATDQAYWRQFWYRP